MCFKKDECVFVDRGAFRSVGVSIWLERPLTRRITMCPPAHILHVESDDTVCVMGNVVLC